MSWFLHADNTGPNWAETLNSLIIIYFLNLSTYICYVCQKRYRMAVKYLRE